MGRGVPLLLPGLTRQSMMQTSEFSRKVPRQKVIMDARVIGERKQRRPSSGDARA
jgi:hypothetical protein